MELKKILIEKMEGNKSIQRSDEPRNLYKALVEAYDADKAILDTYEDSTILKRRREDDDQEGPSAGSDQGSKRQKKGGEHASASIPSETATEDYLSDRGTPHSVFETGADDQPIVQISQHPEWFSQPRRPPSSDHAWNKTLPAAQGDAQSWISDLASLTELEYHLEEVYKANTDQLDWVNPEGQQYPHNLLQPLPLIPDNRVNWESALDIYSKRRIIVVTELKIVE
nr:hypothetical protein [Tanacetum cinerariifolium]